jgi:hypothetical protein
MLSIILKTDLFWGDSGPNLTEKGSLLGHLHNKIDDSGKMRAGSYNLDTSYWSTPTLKSTQISENIMSLHDKIKPQWSPCK